jgi:hypothetical protein
VNTRKGSGLRASPPIDARRPAYGDRADQRDTLALTEKPDATLANIEETQAALRESIETAKQLVEKSDLLLQKHKQKLEQDTVELDAHLRKDADLGSD